MLSKKATVPAVKIILRNAKFATIVFERQKGQLI